jgi:hypothetical protein
MATYDDQALSRIPPTLLLDDKEYVLVFQDETIFHTNEYCWQSWLIQDQQAIWKKGYGQVVYVSNFISETIRWIKLSGDQISKQLT